MKTVEIMNLRFVLIGIMAATGLFCGFACRFVQKPYVDDSPIGGRKVMTVGGDSFMQGTVFAPPPVRSRVKKKMPPGEVTRMRWPSYNQSNGLLESELKAEQATIPDGMAGKIDLIKPKLYRYSADGKTVINLVMGDFGELYIDPSKGQEGMLQSVRIWGNVQAFQYKDPMPSKKLD